MQGLWKDTKKHFVKDKRRAFHRVEKCSHGAEEKAIKSNNHYYEIYDGFGYNRYYITKFYGFRIGKDIPWKMFFNETLHNHKISRRKYAQKLVSGKDRMIQRVYIAKGDFDIDVPTHGYSKSISYMIH